MKNTLEHIQAITNAIQTRLEEEIIGQKTLLQLLIISVFSGQHALLEWAPWLGKTRAIRALAAVFSLEQKRISFTPDLIPSDIIGAEIYKMHSGTFEIRRGPIFTNILLADEINRTPPKVQSALLEAMEERQVTISNETFHLPKPFFVFATQNSLENEGTYPLPEAQLDRFFIKIPLSYPHPEDEIRILQKEIPTKKSPILGGDDLLLIRDYIQKNIRVSDEIYDYITRILAYLREKTSAKNSGEATLSYAPSTRAGLALITGAKTLAAMNGRDFVLPEDIKFLCPYILAHRIGLSYFSLTNQLSTEKIIHETLESVSIFSRG